MQVHNIRNLNQNARLTVLVICWSIGLTLGLLFGFSFSGMMEVRLRLACISRHLYPAIGTILPIMLVWLFTWHALQGLIYPLLFVKAFLDGVVFFCLYYAFGSAVWLVAPMLLISDRIATILLIFFSAICISADVNRLHRTFALCLSVILVVNLIDHFFIASYLSALVL